MYVGVGPPPPPGTATKEGEGGVGEMGFRAIPPLQSNFLPALCFFEEALAVNPLI